MFGNVGILPTPSKRHVAYSVLAQSRSVTLSTDFKHLKTQMVCRWNTPVQPSCGQLEVAIGRVSSGLFAAACSSGWDCLAG